MTSSRSKALVAAALAVAIAILVAVASVGSDASGDQGDGTVESGSLPIYRLDTDHATYAAVPQVSGASPVILTGEVLSHSFEAGESAGVDALGDPLPPVPHTNYSVNVIKVLKGNVSPGGTIVVSLSGGRTSEGEFILDGAPEINDGDVSMFFLEALGGRYYPLAGGAAVATRSGGETFVLPPDATGEEALPLTEAAVLATLQVPKSEPPTAPPPAQPPAGAPAVPAKAKPAPAHCRKGYKKKKVKGKVKCVRAHHGRHKHRRHHH
jgi:hypothetical protein